MNDDKIIYPADLTGYTFGRLTVLEEAYINGDKVWRCQCSCPDHKITYASRKALISGNKRSCGCLAREARKIPNSGHFKPIDHADLLGQKFGKLTVLSIDHKTGRHYYYKCSCDCGRDDNVIKERSNFLNNINLQCNLCHTEEIQQKAINEIIGKQFGRLTVLSFDHMEPRNDKGANSFIYKCQCSCPEKNIVLVDKYSLTSGNKRSCGCLAREVARESHTTHGMSGSRFYKEWDGMIQRTTNPNNDSYREYGARGIKVCDRWRYSFENFKDDMYITYQDHVATYGESETTIERINVDGNYDPSNCTWATKAEQNRNMTTNIRCNYNGVDYIGSDINHIFFPNMPFGEFYRKLSIMGYGRNSTLNLEDIKNIDPNNFKAPRSPISFDDNIKDN